MYKLTQSVLCCIIAFVATVARAEDDPKDILNRADRLVALRDSIVSEHDAWSLEYAKEDTQFAKQQRVNYEQFSKKVNAKATSEAVDKGHQGLQIRFVSMGSIIKMPKAGTETTPTVLDLSSGQLHPGPDITSLKKESSEGGTSLTSLLARDVQKSGDMALLENSFLIPSGMYAKLGEGSLQYYSGVDLSDRVRKHDPTCQVRKGEVLIIETAQEKYALVQYLGKYQEQVLLAVAYQPNGSAVFEFGVLSKPKELQFGKGDVPAEDVALAMFLQDREMFFWKEVRALTDPLNNIEKNARLTDDQQERVKQSKKKLGLAQ